MRVEPLSLLYLTFSFRFSLSVPRIKNNLAAFLRIGQPTKVPFEPINLVCEINMFTTIASITHGTYNTSFTLIMLYLSHSFCKTFEFELEGFVLRNKQIFIYR